MKIFYGAKKFHTKLCMFTAPAAAAAVVVVVVAVVLCLKNNLNFAFSVWFRPIACYLPPHTSRSQFTIAGTRLWRRADE